MYIENKTGVNKVETRNKILKKNEFYWYFKSIDSFNFAG